jgi:inner membrane protein
MELGWILLLAGALFLLAEVAIPGFFAVVPGTILVIIGGLMIIAPDLVTSPWGLVLFVVITIVVSALTIAFYKRLAPIHKPITTGMDSLVGRTGEVIAQVSPDTIDGKVKIDSQVWSATSDECIEACQKVAVVKVSGVHLFVKKVE